jgi:hypothetical protein
MKATSVRWIALLCVVASATLAVVEVWPATAERIRTQDQNGDGRPDIWRHYDAKGLLTQVAVDTNFDGRPDIQEYYERGALVRRESDRNFNGQADLVEDFDAATQRQTRSVVDTDYDGTADLLVLFRDGRPVFSRRAHPRQLSSSITPIRASERAYLEPLSNPFESDSALRAPRAPSSTEGYVGLSTSGGLPTPRMVVIGPLCASAQLVGLDIRAHALIVLPHRSTRAPPASL